MRRSGVSVPPEAIWLGESWEEPPTRARRRAGATPESRRVEASATLTPPAAQATLTPPAPQATPTPPERRTVTIKGRGAERDLTWTAHQSRRRTNRPVHERPGFKPDRAAMWAVLLGLLLVLVAATSSHAAVRAHFTRLPSASARALHSISAPVPQSSPSRPRA
jgi:hypothetical protein